jgi:RNA polymerase sigma-70 factor, ECF subfamily
MSDWSLDAPRLRPADVLVWLAADAEDAARVREADAGEIIAGDLVDVHAASQGDGEAYARLIARHQQQIAVRMRAFARQRSEIEELTQDVFVEAYLSLRSYRGRAPFAHWLQRIATRVGYRYWKRLARDRRRAPARLESDDIAASEAAKIGAEAASDAAEAGELVHRLLEQLPPRDRLVLTLMYLEGHSVAVTASLAGWSVPMVKVQAFRARNKLKRLLEADA